MRNRIPMTGLALAASLAASATLPSPVRAASPSARDAYSAGRWAPVESIERLGDGSIHLVIERSDGVTLDVRILGTTRTRAVTRTAVVIDRKPRTFLAWYDEREGAPAFAWSDGSTWRAPDDGSPDRYAAGLLARFETLTSDWDELRSVLVSPAGTATSPSPEGSGSERGVLGRLVDIVVEIVRKLTGAGDEDDDDTCGPCEPGDDDSAGA